MRNQGDTLAFEVDYSSDLGECEITLLKLQQLLNLKRKNIP